MNNIKNLYVIGNGFDIHHGINSKYSDFRKWLEKNNPMLENRLFQVYDLHSGNLWASLENNLGKITPQAILGDYVYSSLIKIYNDDSIVESLDFNSDIVGDIGYSLENLYNDLECEFENWILQLNDGNLNKRVILNKNNSFFINFNYTSTLERMYGVTSSNILYIHGSVASNDNLVFGHNKTTNELLEEWRKHYSGEELEKLIDAAYDMKILYKDVNSIIRKNESFWKTIFNVDTIHVWGLSLSDVDLPYIKQIADMVNLENTQWEFSCYSESDKTRIMDIISNFNIKKYSIISLNDIISFNAKQLSLFEY